MDVLGELQGYDAMIIIIKGRLVRDNVDAYIDTHNFYNYELFRDIKPGRPQDDIFVYCVSPDFDPTIVDDINKMMDDDEFDNEGL